MENIEHVLTDDIRRLKGSDIPIDGRYPEMALEIRRALGWLENARRVYTTRMAARKTGVSYGTMATMARGDRPKADTLQKFAEGMGLASEPLLRAAGYLPMVDQWMIVEVMGHQTYAGRVTEQVIAGQPFIRVNVPEVATEERVGWDSLTGKPIFEPLIKPAFTRFIGPGSVYGMTPTTEEIARAAAAAKCSDPVSVYIPVVRPLPARQLQSLVAGPHDPFVDPEASDVGGLTGEEGFK